MSISLTKKIVNLLTLTNRNHDAVLNRRIYFELNFKKGRILIIALKNIDSNNKIAQKKF